MLRKRSSTLHTIGCFAPENLFAAVIRKICFNQKNAILSFSLKSCLAEKNSILHFSLAEDHGRSIVHTPFTKHPTSTDVSLSLLSFRAWRLNPDW
jgi:hypothetical protein